MKRLFLILLFLILFTINVFANDFDLVNLYRDTDYFYESLHMGKVIYDNEKININYVYNNYIYNGVYFTVNLRANEEYIFKINYSAMSPNPRNMKRYDSNFRLNFIVNGDVYDSQIIDKSSFNSNSYYDFIKEFKFTPSYDGTYTIGFKFESFLINYKINNIYTNAEVLERLEVPIVTCSSNPKSLLLSWNNVNNADKYYIEYYISSKKYTKYTTDNSILISGLKQNTEYKFKFKSISDGTDFGDSKFITYTFKTRNYFVGTPDNYNVDSYDTYVIINWDNVLDTNYYELKFNNEVIRVHGNSYTIKNLEVNKDYICYLRQVNINGDYSEWKEINFKTLPPPEIPPYQVEKLDLLDKGYDFIEVQASAVKYADMYYFYLNNKFVGSSETGVFKFENLESDTTYSLSVRAVNKYGESRFPRGLIIKTLEYPYPKVNYVSSYIPSSSKPFERVINWTSENVQEGYKILINGEEVYSTLDPGQKSANIDLTGYDGDHLILEVLPIDNNGIGYKTNLLVNTTNNTDLDNIVFKIINSLEIIKKGGKYLLFLLVGLGIFLISSLFIFYQFKLHLTTDNDELLQSNPSKDVVYDIKKLDSNDKTVKDISEKQEKNYYTQEKENKLADNREVKKKGIISAKSDAIYDNFNELPKNYIAPYKIDGSNFIVRIRGKNIKVNLDKDIYNQLESKSNYEKLLIFNAYVDYTSLSKMKKLSLIASNRFLVKSKRTIDDIKIKENRERLTNKYLKYRVNNDNTITFQIRDKVYRKFDIGDFENQLRYSNLDKYTKDMIINSIEHYQNTVFLFIFKDKKGWVRDGELNHFDIKNSIKDKKDIEDTIIKQFKINDFVYELELKKLSRKEKKDIIETVYNSKIISEDGNKLTLENGKTIDIETGEIL